MRREDPGNSHPIINECGGAWVVPWPGEGGPWARAWSILNAIVSHIFSMSPKLSLTLACLTTPGSLRMHILGFARHYYLITNY
jgi:hypothetical protein